VPISVPEPLLQVSGLHAGYGKVEVLHGVNLTIGAGEAVALLGPNGAGKTTLLRAVSGLLPWSGQIGSTAATWQTPRRATRCGRGSHMSSKAIGCSHT
jgi:branched-chain amino acid transport system ATP-binding protein